MSVQRALCGIGAGFKLQRDMCNPEVFFECMFGCMQ